MCVFSLSLFLYSFRHNLSFCNWLCNSIRCQSQCIWLDGCVYVCFFYSRFSTFWNWCCLFDNWSDWNVKWIFFWTMQKVSIRCRVFFAPHFVFFLGCCCCCLVYLFLFSVWCAYFLRYVFDSFTLWRSLYRRIDTHIHLKSFSKYTK